MYSTKDLIPLLTLAAKKPTTKVEKAVLESLIKDAATGYAGGKAFESKKTVLHRLIALAEKRIISADSVEGSGHSSTRYYNKKTVLEILIAFELIRFGLPFAQVEMILKEYRQELTDAEAKTKGSKKTSGNGENINYIHIGVSGASSSITFREKPFTVNFSEKSHTVSLVLNVGALKYKIKKMLG